MAAIKKTLGKKLFSFLDFLEKRREREREIERLRDLVADQAGQLEELRRSRLISVSEQQAITQLRITCVGLEKEINELAMWLRENKAKEIAQGRHAGMSVSQVCIMYMARGLDQ